MFHFISPLLFISDDLMVIVEFCRYGCLQSVLIKCRPTFIDQINRETDRIDLSINARNSHGEQTRGSVISNR